MVAPGFFHAWGCRVQGRVPLAGRSRSHTWDALASRAKACVRAGMPVARPACESLPACVAGHGMARAGMWAVVVHCILVKRKGI